MKKLFLSTAFLLALGSLFIFSCGGKDDGPAPDNGQAPGPGQFKDTRDGQNYDSIRLGNQVWMKQNLNYNVSGSKCPANNSDSCTKYGKLYTYTQATNACPAGWHLPSDDEWKTLEKHFGMTDAEIAINESSGDAVRGNKRDSLLKENGFNALYAGYFSNSTNYLNEGYASFWATNQIYRFINRGSSIDQSFSIQKYTSSNADRALSIRCIKD